MSQNLLEGWKEIAAHLGVSLRKAQYLESREGLPVRRASGGKKPPVFAVCVEIDAWKQTRTRVGATRRRVTGLKRIALGTGCLLVLASAFVPMLRETRLPFRIQRIGSKIKVLDRQGRTCWVHTLPDANEAVYVDHQTGPLFRRGRLFWVTDLDLDGQPEVLMVHVPSNDRDQSSRLICFDANGERLWEFKFGRSITVGDRHFADAFQGSIVGIARGGDARYLIALAVQNPFFPTQVVMLDPSSGQLIDDYWHPGRFYATKIVDLDQDGADELLMAGINNPGAGLGHAVLAVLDTPFRPGDASTVGYFGNAVGKERDYLVFPRPKLFNAMQLPPSAFGLAVSRERVFVEIGAREPYKIVYELDRNLALRNVYPSDSFLAHHRQLLADQKLTQPATVEEDSWRQVLRYPTAPNGNDPTIAEAFRRGLSSSTARHR